MTERNDIPSQLFDWIGKFDFDDLSIECQKLVLNYLSKSEYDSMRIADNALQNAEHYPLYISSAGKEVLSDRFDQVHTSRNTATRIQLRVWQAAAILLLIAGTAMTFHLFHLKSYKTVAIKQPATPIITKVLKTHDTVYIASIPPKNTGTHGIQLNDLVATQKAPLSNEEITIVTLNDNDSHVNSKGGSSIKDDTLILNFHYVSL